MENSTTTLKNTFTDNTGREWAVNLTVGVVARIKTQTGIDLSEAVQDGEAFVNLFLADPMKRGRLLYIAAGAEAAGVSEDDFYNAIGRRELSEGCEAVVMSMADLHSNGKLSAAIKRHMKAMLARMDEVMVAAWKEFDPSKPAPAKAG